MTRPACRQGLLADPPADRLSPLTTWGTQIVDAAGRTVVLGGTNIGRWLLQECGMSPAGDATLAGHEPDTPPRTVLLAGPSRRTSGRPQDSGQWITLDMGCARTFNQIAVDAGDWPQDCPEGVVIRISDDGRTWRDVGWVGGVSGCHVLRLPHLTTRRVQVMLTHPRPGQWWSITEIRLTVSDEFHTRARLADRFGAVQALLDVYRDNWFTTADFDRLAGVGFYCLRLRIDWQLILDPSGAVRPADQAAARAEDPDHIVMVAVFPDWEHALPPARFGWTTVVHQTHHHNFPAQDHHDGLRAFIRHEIGRMERFRADRGMPVHAGEFRFTNFPDLYAEWLSALNRLGLSRTRWSDKVKNPPGARGADAIAAKWAAFRTENFRPDRTMQAIYRRHARQEADHDA
jgi:hypothetical protein